jgi:DNA-directed RNA polymerase sigma subunit (sigma70/sigma32)
MNIQAGNILMERTFYKVVECNAVSSILVTENGQKVEVTNDYIKSLMSSANSFDKTVTTNRTELNKVIEANQNVVMTLNFDKQIKPEDALKALLRDHSIQNIQRQLTPENRTIVGRHFGLDENGRYSFVDMEQDLDTSKTYDNRMRQVDPRTIKYAIINNTQYIVK